MAYATTDELAAALRITRTTPEIDAVLQKCLDAAAVEIDDAIDARPIPPEPIPEVRYAPWLYSSGTAATDPGSGAFRTDKPTASASRFIYLSKTDADGGDRSGITQLQTDDVLDLDGAGQYRVTGAAVDNLVWVSVPVEYLGGTLSFTDGRRYIITGDRPTTPLVDPGEALKNRVNVLRGVEWWKANDAAFGVIGFDQTGAVRAPRDSFARHVATLMPLKEQWGIA